MQRTPLATYRRPSWLFLIFLLSAAGAWSQVGYPDPNFNPSFDTGLEPRVTVPEPDGKILVGGSFSTVDGVGRTNLARLNADGSLDSSFNAQLGSSAGGVNTIAVAPDNKILVGGWFTSVAGAPQNLMVRLNPDGSVDSSFHSAIDLAQDNNFGPFVTNMVVQPDDKIIVSGVFVSVSGTASKYLARLNGDGSRDANFTAPILTTRFPSVTLLQDHRILLWGAVATVNGVARSIALLNADGSFDQSFNPAIATGSVTQTIGQLQQLPSGQILLAGSFPSVNGVSRPGVAILNLDGSLDPAYGSGGSATANYCSTFETGGAVVISDYPIGPIYRVLSDGSVDASFNPSVVGAVGSSMIFGSAALEDGSVLVSCKNMGFQPPQFTQSIPRQLAKIYNQPATSVVTVLDKTRIQWLRGGSTPLTNQVFFEFSADGLTNWTMLGAGTFGGGAWQITGLNLPNSGFVRGKAMTITSTTARASGFVGHTTFYNLTAPALRVEQPAGTQLASGSTVSFTSTDPGRGTTRDFTIRNPGSATLSGVAAAFSGPNASMFSLVAAPATSVPGPGGATSFTVQFTPASAGQKTATLQIASNDPAQAGYQLTLTGTGLASGIVDPNFNPQTALLTSPPTRGVVYSAALNPSGQIYVGGQFDAIGGLARTNVGRINPDGSADSSFHTTADGFVFALAVQNDGKLLVGGTFGKLNGQPHGGFGRFNADGTVDSSFNPAVSSIQQMLIQADGKIVTANWNDGTLARVNPDGSPDAGFASALPPGGIPVMLLQPDGRIVVGYAVAVNNQYQTTFHRLNSDGSLDQNFHASVVAAGAMAMALQADGKIVFSGFTSGLGGGSQSCLARLNADGTIDGTFNIAGSTGAYWTVSIQADGKILVGGSNNVIRFHADGTPDNTFSANTDSDVLIVASQANGDALAGGQFANPPGGFFRVVQDNATDALSAPSVDRVQWLRGGSAPEVTSVSFDLSTDGGTTWSVLGGGTRIAGGWSLGGLLLPQTGQVRARGRTQNGGYNWGSDSSLVQSQSTVNLSFTALQSWRALQGLPADGTQDLATPAGDGVANLLKYAFNMAPHAGDLALADVQVLAGNGVAGLPAGGIDAQGRLVIQFVRRKASTNPGIASIVETGSAPNTLMALSLAGASVVSIDSTWERVTVTDPTVSSKRFGRVRIQAL
jgi:uncharacterized delta-60 repeat protein